MYKPIKVVIMLRNVEGFHCHRHCSVIIYIQSSFYNISKSMNASWCVVKETIRSPHSFWKSKSPLNESLLLDSLALGRNCLRNETFWYRRFTAARNGAAVRAWRSAVLYDVLSFLLLAAVNHTGRVRRSVLPGCALYDRRGMHRPSSSE